MFLQKYLRTIEKIDPGKIYVENVRSLYNIPRFVARVLCEMAVQENIFAKKIGLVCPNSDCNRIIEDYDSYDEIPDEIVCEICQTEEKENSTFKTLELKKIEFYRLKKSHANI